MEIALGDKVLLRNEVSHKLVAKYTGHFKIESVEDRNIIIISGKKKTTTSPQGQSKNILCMIQKQKTKKQKGL